MPLKTSAIVTFFFLRKSWRRQFLSTMAARSQVYDYFTKEVVVVKNSKTNIDENVTFFVCSLRS